MHKEANAPRHEPTMLDVDVADLHAFIDARVGENLAELRLIEAQPPFEDPQPIIGADGHPPDHKYTSRGPPESAAATPSFKCQPTSLHSGTRPAA